MKARLKRQILSLLLVVLFVYGQAEGLSIRALESEAGHWAEDEAEKEEYSVTSNPGDKSASGAGEIQAADGVAWLSGISLLSSGEMYIDLSSTNSEMKSAAGNSRYYNYDGDKTITILDNAELIVTGSTNGNYVLVVEEGATAKITLSNVVITVDSSTSALLLKSGSKVNLVIAGENILRGGTISAGIQIPANAELYISEAEEGGVLTASGGTFGAGIGGAIGASCGTVTVKSGTVKADGGSSAAGIGGGYTADGGKVNIEGGAVAARGGIGGAGIGGGNEGSGGTVKITGGAVTATGGMCAAGIGGGYAGTRDEYKGGGIVIISGGDVRAEGGDSTAAGDDWGADVGCGGVSPVNSGSLTIENNAVLELVKNGALAENISIGECVIKGDGAGSIRGAYSLLTVNGGAASMTGGGWPEAWKTYPGGQVVRDGTKVLLAAGERADYTFIGWSVNIEGMVITDNTFAMPAQSLIVTADYAKNNADAPNIEKQTTRAYATAGERVTLELIASVTDGGTLSYQWYKAEDESKAGGTSIDGAIYSTFSPDTGFIGESFYYVVVTNNNEQAGIVKTASTVSDVIRVTVSEKTYTLSIEAGTGGKVLSAVSGNYPEGAKISIEAEALEGYIFTSWSSTGGGVFDDSGSPFATFTMPAADTEVKAGFEEKVNAQKPKIEIQPREAEVSRGERITLAVSATAYDGGTLSCQWYKAGENSCAAGTPIDGAIQTSFMPDTRTIGESYYYVVVTNLNEAATGEKTASITSDVVRINVSENTYTLTIEAGAGGRILSDASGKYPEGAEIRLEAEALEGYIFTGWSSTGGGAFDDSRSLSVTFTMPGTDTAVTASFEKIVNAQKPKIEIQPEDAEVTRGESIALAVTAAAQDGGTLSFQWYKAKDNSSVGGTLVDGAIYSSFVPDTATIGESYYYVVVTNLYETATGEKTASTTSNVARIRVSEKTYTMTIRAGTGGKILSDLSGKYPEGAKISIEAEALEGYIFTGWSSTGGGAFDDSGSLSTTFTMPGADITVTAGFIYSQPTGVHSPYISGFNDGTFRPDSAITRAQVAQMLYNLCDTYDITSYFHSFSDVSQKDWYYDAVMYLAEEGIILGYTDGTFKPNAEITRAEFTALAVRYAGLTGGGVPGFTDVESGHWAAGYIAAAERAGLVEGYSDGTFGPGKSMKRAEAVTLLNRILDRAPEGNAFDGIDMPFSDVVRNHWAWANIIEAAVEHPAH